MQLLPPDLPLLQFAIALLIGALIGVEREKKQAASTSRGIGGLRTFMLISEAGAIAAWLSEQAGAHAIFVAGGVAVAALVVAGYAAAVRRDPGDVGLTTEAAGLVVYLLGGLTLYGQPGLAVALAIATLATLAFKEPMHGVVDRIGRDDLYAGVQLLFATFIVLPVLPDRALDPWGALNPYRMWWLVILISALSLLGYAATRVLGSGRGVPLTGLFGGLVSSTATTLGFARQSRDDATSCDALAAGILLSWTVMFARIALVAGAIHAPVARAVALPLAVPFAVSLAAAGLAYRKSSTQKARTATDVPLTNPFSLPSAIRFALLFAAVMLVVKVVQKYAPSSTLYGVAALAGLTDVDAITLSMATSAREGATAVGVAANAVVIAALANSIVKLGLVVGIGAGPLKRRIATATALLCAGAVAVLLLR